MKAIFLFLLLLIGNTLCAQQPLTVDAGSDHIICSTSWGVDTTQIGGQPSAIGGVPPYSYSWQFKYPLPFSNTGITIYGSELLNDTTLANPQIIGRTFGNELDLPYMVLTVTDSVGTTVSDSIQLIFSVFGYTTRRFSYYMNQEDSIFFSGGSDVANGVGPLTYLWQPNHGLSDSTSANNFWLKPDTTIKYYVTATDSLGCSATGASNYITITVFPLGIEEEKPDNTIKIYPNPTSDFIQIDIADFSALKGDEFILYDMLGSEMVRASIQSNQQKIDVSQLARGNYSYIIGNLSGKIVLK